jgi:succinyl-diaminopimelate desuccinylase
LRSTLRDAASRSSREIVALARALVAVPSAYPPGDTHAVADAIEAMFEGFDVSVERFGTLPHVMNLVVRVRGAAPGRRLVFNGHLDTFPLVNAKQWSADFNGEERDGKLFGLGVSDMKGGLAAIIFALRHLADCAIRSRARWSPRLPATKKAWARRAAATFWIMSRTQPATR